MLADMAAEGAGDEVSGHLQGIGDAPAIDPRWRWLWDAWAALTTARPMVGAGMAGVVGLPLPWPVIEDYADRLRCDATERQTLHQVLGALDAVHMRHQREQMKAEAARS